MSSSDFLKIIDNKTDHSMPDAQAFNTHFVKAQQRGETSQWKLNLKTSSEPDVAWFAPGEPALF